MNKKQKITSEFDKFVNKHNMYEYGKNIYHNEEMHNYVASRYVKDHVIDLYKIGVTNAGRLVVPILDTEGELVAFAFRNNEGDSPKWVNTSFPKRQCVYGLFEGMEEIQRTKHVYVVEGYFDVFTLASAGIRNVVAVMGSNITDGQAYEISKYVNNVTLMFDGDVAGTNGMLKALNPFLKVGINPDFVRLPLDMDPSETLILYGKDALLLYEQRNLLDFCIEVTVHKAEHKTVSQRYNTVQKFAEILRCCKDKSLYLDKMKEVVRAI